ncbi:MAG: alpha/beta hydrolase [Ruminococcaceae bacterium]|nr:alpha/beta hydrolase [Oscillospiraceae bacterium]
MKAQEIVLNSERNVTLTAYIQNVGGGFSHIQKRPAMIVMPGGGYYFCSDTEADPIAFIYMKAGFQVFILRYSVDEHKAWSNPLDDYEQAYKYICDRSEEWAVDTNRIAVIGFSAGGHLAGCAATISNCKPNAAILGYPVLNGETARYYNPSAPDVTQSVDENTCPCFIFASRNDNVVPIENSIGFIDALNKNGVGFECHIYSDAPHGFSVADETVNAQSIPMCTRTPNWTSDSIAWLKEIL